MDGPISSNLFTQEVDTNGSLQFQKRRELFIRTRNEPLSIVTMCVNNPDRPPLPIHRCGTTPTPSGFAETVSDVFQYFTGSAYFY
jgi:hypothetical protein